MRCAASAMIGKVDQPLQLRLLDQLCRAFGDVDGDVTDPLDVPDDLQRRRDEAQIARHGLFEGQNLVAEVVDFEFKLVERVVALDDFFGQRRTPFHERADRIGDHLLGVMTHQQQLVLQGSKLLFELFAGVFPFRHRTTLAESPGDVIFSFTV